MSLPHFDVFCDLLLNRRTATWNLLFYIITKQTTTDRAFLFDKILQRKPAFAHFGEHEKSHLTLSIIYKKNEAISLVAMRSKEL